ncbi:hypothetical protein P4T23_15465 [Bacillus spizizenii]|uniref:hypothetical protein n=1 Tax=Bacillus spizizenii TaxID=96241 RepID=UPI002E21D1BF|nr:hypothetical protein [Bacillus spizizenii]MED1072938.1 hypothetical protein [Bacillus spizizenii]
MKPSITKEQAEELETWRFSLLEDVKYFLLGVCNKSIGGKLKDLDIMTLAAALVNGYEIEKTPEEKVREFYDGFKGDPQKYPAETHSRCKTSQRVIKCTLNLLGIEIKGVNA